MPNEVNYQLKLREGLKKNALSPPPPVSEKKRNRKNDPNAMNRNLYDMGPLTLVRWVLQRAFNFEPPFRPGSKLKRVLSFEIKKKMC